MNSLKSKTHTFHSSQSRWHSYNVRMYGIHAQSINLGGCLQWGADYLKVLQCFVMATQQIGKIVDQCQCPCIFLANFLHGSSCEYRKNFIWIECFEWSKLFTVRHRYLHYRERFSNNFEGLVVPLPNFRCSTLYSLMIYRMFVGGGLVQPHRHFAINNNYDFSVNPQESKRNSLERKKNQKWNRFLNQLNR